MQRVHAQITSSMEEGQEASSLLPCQNVTPVEAVGAVENGWGSSKRRRDVEQREMPSDGAESMDFGDTDGRVKRQHVSSPTPEAIPCLPLELEKDENVAPEKLAEELARCLHESKPLLILDVVKVLGTARSIELFHKTVETQRNGGLPTADGRKRRAPGGVFLALLKSSTTANERGQIFAREKRIKALKTKKAREAREKKRKRELEMEMGAGLGVGNFTLELMKMTGGGDGTREHPPDKNMEKRWNYRKEEAFQDREEDVESVRQWEKQVGKNEEEKEDEEEGELEEGGMEYTDLDNPNGEELDSFKLGEGWRNEIESDNEEDDFVAQLSQYERLRKKESHTQRKQQSSEIISSRAVVDERRAADQFDSTESCDLGVEIDFNF